MTLRSTHGRRLGFIIVTGRPVSIQAQAASRHRWMNKVRRAAAPIFGHPLTDDDLQILVTYFYRTPPSFDVDNVSKPICDALSGVAYNDDSQLVDRHVRKRDIGGSYHLEGVAPQVVEALAEGKEFVCIEISKLGDAVHQL